jgi:hypothetical protein
MDIMTGLSALTQALNVANWLRGIEKEFDAAEFKMKIADLYSSLAEAKMDAKTEMDNKQAEIAALLDQFQGASRNRGVRRIQVTSEVQMEKL